jgi:type II secretory pathway component PulC
MKKFNFNFKFLDRFKKKHNGDSDVDSDTFETSEDVENEEEINNFHTASKKQFQESPSHIDDDNYTDENPEEFAEKSLRSFNLNKFRTENPDIVNDNLDEVDKTDSNINYQQMEIDTAGRSESTSRFKFKFPKFSSESTKDNIKARFSNSLPMKDLNNFKWNDFILKLFSPYSRGKIHGAFVILLVVVFTYLIGKSAALFMGRSAPLVTGPSKSSIAIPMEKPNTITQDLNKISTANLFNIKENDKGSAVKEKKDIASIICNDAEKPTSEPLKLLDTIVLQDSVKSVASVQVRGAPDLVNVREGEQLNNTVEVSKINRMKIILKNLNTGECEYIASEDQDSHAEMPDIQVMSAKKGASLFKSTNPEIKNVGNNFKIKRAFRDKMINNMSEVLTQAKAIQITNPDGSLSFKMTEVVPGSIYSQLDIQNDDVITSINGKKIENLNELMGLLGRVKEIDKFQIGSRRNGVEQNKDFDFE